MDATIIELCDRAEGGYMQGHRNTRPTYRGLESIRR